MATPDRVVQYFNSMQEIVEVHGDYVRLTHATRHGEPIFFCQMSADEADALADKLLDAVAAIDNRNAEAAGEQAEDRFEITDAGFSALADTAVDVMPGPTQATSA